MCIIIAKDAGVKALDKGYFERAWDNNPHGGGLVWKNEGEEVYFQKGFMNKKEFLDKIAEINKDTTSFIAHFRIKSVGEIKPENCHPFVMEKLTFAHNGTLHIDPEKGKTDSETFGNAFLFDKDMSWVKDYKVLLEMALGTSKFAIMDNTTGEIFILNRDCGKERDGAWFSNESAFPRPALPVDRGYSNYWDSYKGYYPSAYKARKDFGTKQFNMNGYAKFIKEKGCFVYTHSNLPWAPPKYQRPLTCGKRGLWKINDAVKPSPAFADKKYDKNSLEIKLVQQYQRELEQGLSKYWKDSYESMSDRDIVEEDLNALHTVLDCMRKLIRAEKEISEKTLEEFCLNNVKRETYANKLASTYDDCVWMYVQEVVDKIEAAKATGADKK